MTREEAKEILTHNWTRVDNPNYSESELDEAFFMAIEALSAEAADVYKAHEEEHLNIINRIKELQYALAKTQTVVGKLVESAEAEKTYIGIDIPYGSDKGLAAIFKGKDDKLILEEVKELMRSWIPCSERLPSDSGNYLITVADLRLGHIGEHTVTIADFYAKAKKWNSIVDVLAWMPLPKPYREDGEV